MRQMLRGKRHIIINPLSHAACKLVPQPIRTKLLSKIVKREIAGKK